jgi:hypothetical protein
MTIAFGQTSAPRAAAGRLAARLCGAMDQRSPASALLLVTVEEESEKARVSMFLLPREDFIRWTGSDEDAEIVLSLIRDAFSTGSGLRKAAVLEGKNIATHFLGANIIDLQIASSRRAVAGFWVEQFLDAKLKITPEMGSIILGEGLRRAFDAAGANQDDRNAVMGAMLTARSGQLKSTSLNKFSEGLPNAVTEAFLGDHGEDVRNTPFLVNQEVVKRTIGSYVIETTDGVTITAPPETIAKSVTFDLRGAVKSVNYSGIVESETVRHSVRETRKDVDRESDPAKAKERAAE